ncbi:MAG TPA: hypothetical protein VMI94_07890 [Bryobacteraceae bacterium]|nr:hypothetical protein [Bryobacteraceae bacterium]
MPAETECRSAGLLTALKQVRILVRIMIMNTTLRGSLSLALSLALLPAFGATPAIGLIVADGSFQIDHSLIWDNGTVFAGNLIETGQASTQLQLQNGAHARLASNSRARVFDTHLVLEDGIGQIETANYRIEAAGLEISPEAKDGIARVKVSGSQRIVVAAYQGEVRVATRNNVLVAKLEPGKELTFESQAAGPSVIKVSGCLTRTNGKLILVDKTTGVKIELRGSGLEKEVGNQVEVGGTADATAPSAPGTSQIVYVNNLKRIAKGGCSGNAPAAAAAAAGGLSGAAIGAIVGGVAVTGSLVGLAVVHALPGQSQSQPATSR